MGTSKSPAHLAAKLAALSVAIPTAAAAGLVKAAAVVEASVGVASGRYRGHAITEVRTVLTPEPTPTALVRMTNRKAHLLDHDTHFPQASRSTALGAGTNFVPREGVRTHGKFMWEKGVTAARPRVLVVMAESLGKTLGRVFG